MNFRLINEIEKNIIVASLSKVSPSFSLLIKDLKNDLYISVGKTISKTKFPEIHLIPKYQFNLLTSLLNEKIVSAGLYFGFLKKGNFFLSLEGLEFLYKNNRLSSLKKIKVTNKGEKSILYGNNVLKNMVVKISEDIKQKEILIIFNKFDEIIAISRSKCDHRKFQKLQPKDTVAISLNDKGYYLRKKQ